ncbi:clathrin-coated vesicle protein [Moniliophthora roreri]|nr:clathrin-coated vesicle protein [Moniliophthora roreri]
MFESANLSLYDPNQFVDDCNDAKYECPGEYRSVHWSEWNADGDAAERTKMVVPALSAFVFLIHDDQYTSLRRYRQRSGSLKMNLPKSTLVDRRSLIISRELGAQSTSIRNRYMAHRLPLHCLWDVDDMSGYCTDLLLPTLLNYTAKTTPMVKDGNILENHATAGCIGVWVFFGPLNVCDKWGPMIRPLHAPSESINFNGHNQHCPFAIKHLSCPTWIFLHPIAACYTTEAAQT